MKIYKFNENTKKIFSEFIIFIQIHIYFTKIYIIYN